MRTLEASLAPLLARLIARVAGAAVLVVGFIYALSQVGISVAPLLGLLGLAGLALAIAFQDILANVIAGVIMSIRRPFAAGDEITTADHSGIVESVELRAVTLRTFDGERVYVPNSSVWGNPMVNHTELGLRRTTLIVGVSYDADLATTGDILVDTLKQVDGVSADPEPQAYAYEFGASSINYALRYWHDPSIATLWQVRDAVVKAVKRALDDAGVEIPFPQRVLTFSGDPVSVNV